MEIGDANFKRAANLILHSIYPPSILHWMRVLGPDNVMIVQSEKLRVHKEYTENEDLLLLLNKIYEFLGLCPFDRIPKAAVHTTAEYVPDVHLLNDTTKSRLRSFFSPYNILLAALVKNEWSYEKSNIKEMLDFSMHATEFVPTYDWQQLKDFETVPANLEIRLPIGPGGKREARIPNPYRLQLALPAPCKYFVRIDLHKTDLLTKIIDAAAKQCKVRADCLYLYDKSFPDNELAQKDTVEASKLFHLSLALAFKENCSSNR